MAKQPKRIKAWTGDRDATHALEAAIKLVKENAKAKFDETIEISVNLGVDPRHADQQVRGVVNLPSGRPTLALTGGARARLESLVPPGMSAQIDLTLTDEPPIAEAVVIISARAENNGIAE